MYILLFLVTPCLVRVRFYDSWFIFQDSIWSFHEPCFCGKHIIFMNHIGWTEHKVMVLKFANKDQIIWHNFENICINDFHHHPFFYQEKILQTSFFTEPKIKKWKDKIINHSNIYLLFNLLTEEVRKIMQHKEIWLVL